MEPNVIIDFVNSVGFPAAAFGAMFYMNYKALEEVRNAVNNCNMSVQICAGAIDKCNDLLNLVLQNEKEPE